MADLDFTTRGLITSGGGEYLQPYYGPEFPLRYRLEVDYEDGGSVSYAGQTSAEQAFSVNMPRAKADAQERGKVIRDAYVVESTPVLALRLVEVDWRAAV